MKDSNIIASLDIGSSKIVCLIGYFNINNKLCVKGIGHQESKGISEGNIQDIKLLTKSVISVISMAETMAGMNIENIVLSISGVDVRSSLMSIESNLKDKIVNNVGVFDLVKKIEKEFKIKNKEIIHLIPTNYYIDSIPVQSPFGIIGNNIQIDFNVIYTDKIKIDNIRSCLKNTPIRVTKFIASSYASVLACLTEQEKSNGCLLIDIGAGLTSFSIIQRNLLICTYSIPIAGNSITVDIADRLKTRFDIAEKIKVTNVDLLLDKNDENDIIKINIDSDEDYRIAKNTKKVINDIYRKKLEEILNFIFNFLDKKKIKNKVKSIVLTGGTVSVNGTDYFVNKITNIDTRIGITEFDYIKNPIKIEKTKNLAYSCAVGLLIKARERVDNKNITDYKSLNKSEISKFFDYLIKLFIN